jgi:hypothetical protein
VQDVRNNFTAHIEGTHQATDVLHTSPRFTCFALLGATQTLLELMGPLLKDRAPQSDQPGGRTIPMGFELRLEQAMNADKHIAAFEKNLSHEAKHEFRKAIPRLFEESKMKNVVYVADDFARVFVPRVKAKLDISAVSGAAKYAVTMARVFTKSELERYASIDIDVTSLTTGRLTFRLSI